MFLRMLAALAALLAMAVSAEARRVALVIGQNAYLGGTSGTTVGLPPLDNPVSDARRMAALLARHGFEVIACDGPQATGPGSGPDCLDLDRARFMKALDQLEQRAAGADLALVFFSGHGTATPEGNILTPTDARLDCATGAIAHGVPVERIMAATGAARHKLVILDACRNNPLDDVCPGLKGRKLSFTRIEAGALRSFLLVTSTQFGQEALDGLEGQHSPFAGALFAALEANPSVYFDQVLNEVARATYEAAQKVEEGFQQIPGRVVGGEAPADCLAGTGCVADPRMVALAVENERLATDASGVRAILDKDEQARGRAYTAEERGKRVAELQEFLARTATSTDPLRQEARRLIDAGNVAAGQAKLDEALDADERAIAEVERVAADRRKAAVRSARDLGVLARGTDVAKAVSYFQRATRLDPYDAETWNDYAAAAMDAGRIEEAKAAYEQAMKKAEAVGDPRQRYWAILGLGDVALAHGSESNAFNHYRAAEALAAPIVSADPGNARWQLDLSASRNKLRDLSQDPATIESYRTPIVIREPVPKAAVADANGQLIGNALQAEGDLARWLAYYRRYSGYLKSTPREGGSSYRGSSRVHSLIFEMTQIRDHSLLPGLEQGRANLSRITPIGDRDPTNIDLQRLISAMHSLIGDVLGALGRSGLGGGRDLPEALESYRASLTIDERLAEVDPANALWQRDLAVSHEKIGEVMQAQDNLPGALGSHRASLAIRERLGKASPGNALWQRDLAVSHGLVALVLERQGARMEAARALEQGRTIIMGLRQLTPDKRTFRHDLSWFEAQLVALKK